MSFSKALRAIGYPILLLILAIVLVGVSFQPSTNYTLYRFANDVITGHGLTYWTPDPPITTYPVAPLLLAAISTLLHSAVPTTGLLLSVVAAMIGGLCLERLTENWIVGVVYTALIVVEPIVLLILMLAFLLAALLAAKRGRWSLAGLLIGMAILTHPIAILMAFLILILAISAERGGRYSVFALVLPVIGLMMLWISKAALVLPTGISSFYSSLMFPLIIGIVGISLLFGRKRGITLWREKPMLIVIIAWSAFTIAWIIATGQFSAALLIPGALVIMQPIWRRGFVVVGGLLIIIAILSPALQPIGAICQPPDPPAGALFATDGEGYRQFAHNGPIIDLSGVVMPQTALDQNFFLNYAPDVIATRQPVIWSDFKTTYTGGDFCALHQRVVNFAPLDDHGVDVPLGRGDLHLSNVAIGRTLHPGDLVRVRLDWELTYLPLAPIEIKLDLLDAANKGLAQIHDVVPMAAWQIGTNQTYHVLVLPSDTPAGTVALRLSVYYHAGTFIEGLKVADMDVVSFAH